MTDNKLALPLGTVLRDEYQIERVLGAGAFGVVYKAVHKSLGLAVAIKEFLPQAISIRENKTISPSSSANEEDFNLGLEKFVDEAKQLIKFDEHPNVVKCRDFFRANGTAYVVMNFEDGCELADILKIRMQQQKPLNEKQILNIIIPILEGLKVIHAAGVLHRDIKPANIFIRRSTEQPVLIDFGAAKTDFNTDLKSSFVHTEGYGPIEQITDIGELGPWSDIYAVGALMWRIIAEKNPTSVNKRIAAESMGSASSVMKSAKEIGEGKYSNGFLSAIDKAIEINAKDRYQSAGAFISALESAKQAAVESVVEEEPLTMAMPRAEQVAVQTAMPKNYTSQAISASEGSSAKSLDSTLTQPLFVKLAIGTIFILLIGGFWLFNSNSEPEAVDAKPSKEVVFSKIERLYELSISGENKKAIINGSEKDIKQLKSIAKDEKASGDPEYQDTMKQISRMESTLQDQKLSLYKNRTGLKQIAFEVSKYRQEWDSYVHKAFEEKVNLAKERGSSDKANLINGFDVTTKEGSRKGDDKSIKQYWDKKFN